MTARRKSKTKNSSAQERRIAKDRDYLVELVHNVEDDDGLPRLFKAAMHLHIQSMLIVFDPSLSAETKSTTVEVLSKAVADLAKAAGIKVPKLKLPRAQQPRSARRVPRGK